VLVHQTLCMLNILICLLILTTLSYTAVNPLSPNSDENEISPDIMTTCSTIQVMRIKEVINKDKMS